MTEEQEDILGGSPKDALGEARGRLVDAVVDTPDDQLSSTTSIQPNLVTPLAMTETYEALCDLMQGRIVAYGGWMQRHEQFIEERETRCDLNYVRTVRETALQLEREYADVLKPQREAAAVARKTASEVKKAEAGVEKAKAEVGRAEAAAEQAASAISKAAVEVAAAAAKADEAEGPVDKAEANAERAVAEARKARAEASRTEAEAEKLAAEARKEAAAAAAAAATEDATNKAAAKAEGPAVGVEEAAAEAKQKSEDYVRQHRHDTVVMWGPPMTPEEIKAQEEAEETDLHHLTEVYRLSLYKHRRSVGGIQRTAIVDLAKEEMALAGQEEGVKEPDWPD